MGARRRKVLADLVGNRSRSVLAMASLAVGIMAVGAMQLASTTVQSSFESSFLDANPPSAMLRTTGFEADLVDELVSHPAVDAVEGRRLAMVRVDAVSGPIDVELVAMDDFAANAVARIDPRQGTWPPGDGEVVVERASVGELGSALDDVVRVHVPGGAELDLTVVGTAFDVWEMAPMLGGTPRAYVSMATMHELTGSNLLDTIYFRAVGEPLDRERALVATAAIRDEVLTPAGVAIDVSEIREPAEHRGDRALSLMVTIMRLLSLLALVIAVALVANTVVALLAQQRRQVGVMKAVGATSGQLMLQYLAYVVSLGAGAFVVALPLSLMLGRFLAGFLAGMANFELEPLGIPWGPIAVELAIAVVLPVLAVLLVVHRTTQATVREAITDRGLTGAVRQGRRPLAMSRPTRLAQRNASRNPARLALTVITIGVCGAVVVGVFSTQVSFGRLTDQAAGYADYDVELALTDPVDVERAREALAGVDGVVGVEGWFRAQAFRLRPDGTENENISMTGVAVASESIRPTITEGRWLDDGDEHAIVINTHFADEERDLVVGGEVLLDLGGRRRAWTVVGVSTTTLVGPVGYVPAHALAAELGVPHRTNLVAVRLTPGVEAAAAVAELDAAARADGLPVGRVQTNAELRAAVGDLSNLFVGLLLFVGAVLAVVAVIGVAGTMTLSVVEQTREIGVLRTLGASSWAVRKMLLVQGVAVAAIGGVVGVIASVPVALLLRSTLSNGLIDAPIPGGFSWPGVAMWLVLALVIGAIGAMRPARVASKLTIRETLAYE
jgi:putative ABC transport system permease protein